MKLLSDKRFIYHVLFWTGVYCFWVVLFRNYSFTLTRTMSVEFCYLAFITIDYYIVQHLLIPKFLLRRKYFLFVPGIATVIGVSGALRALVAWMITIYFFHLNLQEGVGRLYADSVVNISIWVLLLNGGKMLLDRIRQERQLERLEKDRIKSELEFLKAQINPHALFNSLNTVYGQIDKSNSTARHTLLQFSELLRYQLYDCATEKVNLDKEVAYIKKYVDFHRLRKDDRLAVYFDVSGIQSEFQIAPLLLIVLVENAFKFVSNFQDRENRISIRISMRGSVLYCSIVNTKELLQAISTSTSNGIGITNLKRRLDLLYDRKHTLTMDKEGDLYKANLVIDLT